MVWPFQNSASSSQPSSPSTNMEVKDELLSDGEIQTTYFPGTVAVAEDALVFNADAFRSDGEGSFFVEADGGTEVMIRERNGVPDPDGLQLLERIVERYPDIRQQAIRLADSFMKDVGSWSIDEINVAAAADAAKCDFQVALSFSPSDGSDAYGYTDFRACFRRQEQMPRLLRFWPFKLLIEFL